MNIKSSLPYRITQVVLLELQEARLIIHPGILDQGDQHNQDKDG